MLIFYNVIIKDYRNKSLLLLNNFFLHNKIHFKINTVNSKGPVQKVTISGGS